MKSRYLGHRIGIGVAIATVLACGGNNTGIEQPADLASVVVWVKGDPATGGAIYGKVLEGDLATSQSGELYPGSNDKRRMPYLSKIDDRVIGAWEVALFWVEDGPAGSEVHRHRLNHKGDEGDEVVSGGVYSFSPVSSFSHLMWWASAVGGFTDVYYTVDHGPTLRLTTNEGSSPTDVHDNGDGTADLLYTRNAGGGLDFEVFRMDAYDGKNKKNLTNNAWRDLNPRFSPDGAKIVFASNRARGAFNIFMMNADGSGVEALTDRTQDHATPCFSADGKYVVYASKRDGDWDIYALNLATRTEVALTDDG